MAQSTYSLRWIAPCALLGVIILGLVSVWPRASWRLFYEMRSIDALPPDDTHRSYRYEAIGERRYRWYPGAQEQRFPLSAERFRELLEVGAPLNSYFPPPLDTQHHDFLLKSVGEPPLVPERPGVLRAYRLTYMPSFGDSFTIRLEERSSGWWVVARTLGSEGGSLLGPGGSRDEKISAEKAERLVVAFDNSGFWQWDPLGTVGIGHNPKLDVALVVIEAHAPERYHAAQALGSQGITPLFLELLRP